mgnify:CR=1 FL=1
MYRYRIRAQSILIVVALGLCPQLAYACLCPPPEERNPQKLLNAATAVFLGRVVETRLVERTSGYADIEVVVEVERVWKGAPEARHVVYTNAHGGLCGYTFRTGERYLIYTEAEGSRDQLRVGLCGGTVEETRARRDLEVLGTGTEPVALDKRASSRDSGRRGAVAAFATATPGNWLGFMQFIIGGTTCVDRSFQSERPCCSSDAQWSPGWTKSAL